MLVHHVDKTNGSVWNNNQVNANPAHNYYEVVRAGGSSHSGTAYDLFPGTASVKTLDNSTTPANLKSWNDSDCKWGLYNIAMADNKVTFDVKNTQTLESLSIPETLSIAVGLKQKLEVTLVPANIDCTLTWASNNASIAEVDQEGNVTGVSAGTCTITVTSENGCTDNCTVTVENPDSYTIGAFKALESGSEVMLQLTDARVLYSYRTRAFVRDATGCLMFYNMGIDLQPNDYVNGIVYAKVNVSDNMIQAIPIDDKTNSSGLTITSGEQISPREVSFDDLTSADYSDYVLIKEAKLQNINGACYAVSGDKKARVYQKFGTTIAKIPSGYDGKYYDVKGIWGTDHVSGQLIDELYLMETPVEVVPSGIVELQKALAPDTPLYNLQGQRVAPGTKGILICNGKKIVVR